MASKLIPNTFQYPNWYADELDHFLTAQEQVVLKKAVREILGWHSRIESRQARIALSVFVDGKFSRDTGERLAWGCGLSKGAVRKALNGLDQFGILVKCGDATQDGQLFKLEDDSDKVDIAGLQARYEQRIKKNRDKTEIGRGVLSDSRGIVGQNGGHTVGQDKGVLSDNHKETQEKPKETKHVANATPAPVDAVICYRCEKRRAPVDELCDECLADAESVVTSDAAICYHCEQSEAEQRPPPHCRICQRHGSIDGFGVCAKCYLEMEIGDRCMDCEKLKATTAEMPYKNQTCTCEHERELQAAFGDPKPSPAVEVTPHWTEQAGKPWASWGAESDEFQKQLQRFGDSGRIVQELGYKLQNATGLKPLWGTPKKVKWWSSGLWELYEEAGYSIPVAIEAVRKLKASKLPNGDEMTVASPYSFVNVARALAAEKSRKPKRLVIK